MGTTSLKAWILAARLRTLPLSLSGIIAGNALAWQDQQFDLPIFLGALVTATLFQILSNFANDYGDGVKGTDNEHRLGPPRALQLGLLSAQQLKKALWTVSILSTLSAIALIAKAFDSDQYLKVVIFLGLTLFAIGAAIKYTVGQNAYGYRGLGDLFVFIFFGGVSVVGSFYLQTQQISLDANLFAVVLGCLSVGVLNLNNLRDFENDQNSNKKTLVVQWGIQKALVYQRLLLMLATICFIGVVFRAGDSSFRWASALFGLLILVRLPKAKGIYSAEYFDKGLKPLALTAFFSAVGFWCINIMIHGL